ncbi:MAG: hypothetical protein ACFFAS_09475 [Promethearchaeota archaeon]
MRRKIKDEECEIHERIIEAFGIIGDERTIEPLIELMRSMIEEKRRNYTSLKGMHSKISSHAIRNALEQFLDPSAKEAVKKHDREIEKIFDYFKPTEHHVRCPKCTRVLDYKNRIDTYPKIPKRYSYKCPKCEHLIKNMKYLLTREIDPIEYHWR